MQYQIQCEECDSEYSIQYEPYQSQDEPKYCPFCSNPIELPNELDL